MTKLNYFKSLQTEIHYYQPVATVDSVCINNFEENNRQLKIKQTNLFPPVTVVDSVGIGERSLALVLTLEQVVICIPGVERRKRDAVHQELRLLRVDPRSLAQRIVEKCCVIGWII